MPPKRKSSTTRAAPAKSRATGKVSKPVAGKRLEKLNINQPKIKNVPEGFLLCPIPDWPLPAKLVDKISPNKIANCSASDALKRIQEGFQAVQNADVTDQFSRYAENCLQYSRQPEFERSFIPLYEARKARLKDKNLKKWAAKLLEHGINNAGEITEQSMDLLKDCTLIHMNSQEDEYKEDTPLADESFNEDDSLEISDDTDNDDDDEPLLSNYHHSPYKPKLTIQQITEAKSRCYIAFSSMAETSIHPPTRSIFHRYKQQQESLETLKSSQLIYKELINILDETIDFEDFPMNVWKMYGNSTSWELSAAKDLVRVISLTLTDFWGMASRKNFDTKQERSFWVETIVPMFKYLATTSNLLVFSWCESLVHSHLQSQVVPGVWNNTTNKLFADGLGRCEGFDIIIMESSGGYEKENLNHSMDDTWKLIMMLTDSLRQELIKCQDAKYEDAKGLATYGIQCICDTITLMKTTMFDARRWQVIEVRSAKVPVKWNNRSGFTRVFELILTLHMELLTQKTLKTLLKRQHDHLVDVNQKETVRFCLQNSGILEA
ncbi:hypothetical protein INT45_004474 [Circinella minor]|uniref:Uncharacterized protein n=1 Tax=Circinella minor TaxID=1195481 RepID=A0A8H7S3H8_9FUNG|nr:hypothetical protein INT45_004474 [Circinella minor]